MKRGNSTNAGGREGGDAIADGGNGGDGADVCPAFTNNTLAGQISVASDPASSDPFIFNSGSGIGRSLIYRVLGGRGGFGREVQAASGGAALGSGGNGGNGGKGVPGGSRGSAGGPGEGSDPGAGQFNPVFQDGSSGGGCGSLVQGLTMVATGAAAAADQTIEINGSGAWVNVSGTLSDDGTVTASGRGTVAGFADIDVSFAGTWDADTQTLTGTYTMDAEKQISAGHPVVYNVNVSGG